jgi:hypothetical protein
MEHAMKFRNVLSSSKIGRNDGNFRGSCIKPYFPPFCLLPFLPRRCKAPPILTQNGPHSKFHMSYRVVVQKLFSESGCSMVKQNGIRSQSLSSESYAPIQAPIAKKRGSAITKYVGLASSFGKGAFWRELGQNKKDWIGYIQFWGLHLGELYCESGTVRRP